MQDTEQLDQEVQVEKWASCRKAIVFRYILGNFISLILIWTTQIKLGPIKKQCWRLILPQNKHQFIAKIVD
jgi:hypothetical protein